MSFSKRRQYTAGLWLVIVMTIGYTSAIFAQDSGAAISQGFKTSDTNIAAGALVSLKEGVASEVQLANIDRITQLVGVVGDKPLVALSAGDTEAQVVIGGTTRVLVSDLNGEPKAGDKITVSPLNGIGMKATENGQVIGVAQADFTSENVSTQAVKNKAGEALNVRIASIPVQVAVAYYAAPSDGSDLLPPLLQRFAEGIAQRKVSSMRVLLSGILLLAGLTSVAAMLYSSAKFSIVSIGRNPLSAHAIRKSLGEVGSIAAGVLLLTIMAAYLILTV